jgi:hypothetical protein
MAFETDCYLNNSLLAIVVLGTMNAQEIGVMWLVTATTIQNCAFVAKGYGCLQDFSSWGCLFSKDFLILFTFTICINIFIKLSG